MFRRWAAAAVAPQTQRSSAHAGRSVRGTFSRLGRLASEFSSLASAAPTNTVLAPLAWEVRLSRYPRLNG